VCEWAGCDRIFSRVDNMVRALCSCHGTQLTGCRGITSRGYTSRATGPWAPGLACALLAELASATRLAGTVSSLLLMSFRRVFIDPFLSYSGPRIIFA
jgi:hypothetical protein